MSHDLFALRSDIADRIDRGVTNPCLTSRSVLQVIDRAIAAEALALRCCAFIDSAIAAEIGSDDGVTFPLPDGARDLLDDLMGVVEYVGVAK